MVRPLSVEKIKRISTDGNRDEFQNMINLWFQEIKRKVQNTIEFSSFYNSENISVCDNFDYLTLTYEKGFLPYIDEIDSSDILFNILERINSNDFTGLSVNGYKEEYSRILKIRIKQIESSDFSDIKESEIEEIRDIPLVYSPDNYDSISHDFYWDNKHFVKFEDKINDYEMHELGKISERLRLKNLCFRSPHAVAVDTIRYSNDYSSVDIGDLVNIHVMNEDTYINEKEVRFRLEKIIDKINDFMAGLALARLDYIMISKPSNFSYTGAKSGESFMMRDKLKGPFSYPNHLGVFVDEISEEYIENEVGNSYNRDFEIVESVFTHEFGHLIDTCFNNERKDRYYGDKLLESYKDVKEENSHLYSEISEFFALCFDLWINNPEKLKEELGERAHEYFENNFSENVELSETLYQKS